MPSLLGSIIRFANSVSDVANNAGSMPSISDQIDFGSGNKSSGAVAGGLNNSGGFSGGKSSVLNSGDGSFLGSLGSWLSNSLTGDRDFARQLYLQEHQQQFNSAEAAKAFERQVTMAQNSSLWQAEQLRQLGVNPAFAIAGAGGHGLNNAVSAAPTATSAANSAGTSGAQFGATLASLGQLVINAASLAAKANTPVIRYYVNTK